MKSNKQFMILSALGILFVVDAHAWSPLGVAAMIMPYNSYFMPMFMFISGYFFKEKDLETPGIYFGKKIKHLLVPYFAWNTIYGLLLWILRKIGAIYYGAEINLHSLFIMPWQTGSFEIDAPSWFVPVLFSVVVVAYAVRFVLSKLKVWNDTVMQFIYVLLGVYVVYIARTHTVTNEMLPFLKIGFFLQFFQLGSFYKNIMESSFRKCSKLCIMSACLIVDAILTGIYGYLSFNDIVTMSGFTTDNYLLPFITSVVGISFWLCVSDFLVPSLGDNKTINFISSNTFGIMIHHIFLFNVLNLLLLGVSRMFTMIPFDVEMFRSTAWYRMETSDSYRVFYVIFAVVSYILIKKMYLKIKNVIGMKNENE